MAVPTVAAPAQQSAAKRKASVAGLPGSTRPVKRRASKACHCCRSRKVRCDVVESGIPCTNCRLDEVECVVTEGKRRKKSYVHDDILSRSPIESIEEKGDVQQFPLFDDIDGLQDLPASVKPNLADPNAARSLEHQLNHHKPHMIYQSQTQRLTPEERTRRMSSFGRPQLDITPVQLPPHLRYHPPTPARGESQLPPYIAPTPRHMLGEDLDYLHRKGVFFVPEVAIRNELLRSYVQYVHPYLPILDVQDFLSAIDKNQPGNHVSLLLFHAVMFAASAYVDMRYLSAQGFSSRKAARKVYFQRVKLLYDFDWEADRVAVVQAVLLMTFWYESPNDSKDVWYWLGVAISVARTIGMNYDADHAALLTPQRRKLWKRIWWSLYLRDRIIAIGVRRPIRIRLDDFDVPMLELDDFETEALPPELCRMLGGCSAVRDTSKRETLAKMCIALIELCRLVTDVLSTQYSCQGHKIGITSETTVRLVPRKAGADPDEVARCDRELEKWYDALPLELRYFQPASRERTNNHDGEVICVHRALLTAVYLTASSALHRPQMMPAAPDIVIASELKDLSKRRVRDAALDITELYRDLYAHDLIRYLPNTGVTVLLPAIIIHLLDIKSPEESTDQQTSMRHLQFCMQALQKLRDLYSSADFAFSFLDAAIKKSDLASVEGQEVVDQHAERATTSRSVESTDLEQQDHALTPPPEARGDAGGKYVHQALLPGQNSSTLEAMTPPSSGSELNHSGSPFDGLAVSLRDLERFVGYEDEPHHHGQDADHFPAALEAIVALEQNVTTIAESAVTNDFDRLINLEEGTDLFVPNQCHIDDSLFKDIDMEWLADSTEPEPEPEDTCDDDARQQCPVDIRKQLWGEQSAQLATPPDSDTALSSGKNTPSTEPSEKECTPSLAHHVPMTTTPAKFAEETPALTVRESTKTPATVAAEA